LLLLDAPTGDTSSVPTWWRVLRMLVPLAIKCLALAPLGYGVVALIRGPDALRMTGAAMILASGVVFWAARPLTRRLFGSRW
jgi:hypothetical protein